MGRKSLAAERKRQILDAYESLILERGFANTTLDDVAERAGMKRQLLRHHMGNRADIIRELMVRVSQKANDSFEARISGETPEEIAETLLVALIEDGKNDPDGNPVPNDQILRDLFGAALRDDADVRGQFIASFGQWSEQLAQLFRKLAPHRSAEEIDEAVGLTFCLGIGLDGYRGLGLGDQVESHVRKYWQRMISGLLEPNDT